MNYVLITLARNEEKFCWVGLRWMERPASAEFDAVLSTEQMKKLKAVFRTLLKLKKVNNFSVATAQQETR